MGEKEKIIEYFLSEKYIPRRFNSFTNFCQSVVGIENVKWENERTVTVVIDLDKIKFSHKTITSNKIESVVNALFSMSRYRTEAIRIFESSLFPIMDKL